MGCADSKDDEPKAERAASKSERDPDEEKGTSMQSQKSVEVAKNALEFVGGKAIKKFPFEIKARPILKDKKVIVFSTTKKQQTKYRIIDLDDGSMERVKVECDNKSFNIYETVFALNENDNKVYFIQNDKNIFTMDFNENKIISLNKSVTVTKGNHAQIGYNNKTLYILGAEEKSDEDSNYAFIPYSTAITVQSNEEAEDGQKIKSKIRNFGESAQTLAVHQDGSEYLYVFGGRTNLKATPTIADEMWRCQLTNCDDITEQWQTSFLCQPSLFPGIINYNDQYLVSFGGSIRVDAREENPSDRVYVLVLTQEKGLKKNYWYSLNRPLPKKRWFHAIYRKGEDVVHLLSLKGSLKGSEKDRAKKGSKSEYFRIEMKQILDEIDYGEHKGGDRGITSQHTWSLRGKTAIPTKVSVPNLGPKIDEMDSDSD